MSSSNCTFKTTISYTCDEHPDDASYQDALEAREKYMAVKSALKKVQEANEKEFKDCTEANELKLKNYTFHRMALLDRVYNDMVDKQDVLKELGVKVCPNCSRAGAESHVSSGYGKDLYKCTKR